MHTKLSADNSVTDITIYRKEVIMAHRLKKRWPLVVFAVALTLFVILALVARSNGDNNAAAAPTRPASESSSAPAECDGTWKMKATSPSNGDLVEDVPSIRAAQTKAEARAAANDWVQLVKNNAQVLKGAASILLNKQIDASVLVKDGCATKEAVDLVNEMKTTIALSDVSADEAPASGYNTFAKPDSGEVYAVAGKISGDRKAVKIVTHDGRTVWVMARCGNPVTTSPPPVPHKKTPPETPPTPSKCVPPTVPYEGRCVKPAGQNDPDGTGGNNSPASQPVKDHPQGSTPGAGSGSSNPKGPKPQDGSPAPNPTPGGYDSGSSNGSGTPGGSTCDNSGCSGGGATPPSPGTPPVVDDGGTTDPGGF